jgi:hypothetical protein
LEDISILPENARFKTAGGFLPTESQIRRRSQWLDFPRGIIRGRREIGDYDFDVTNP